MRNPGEGRSHVESQQREDHRVPCVEWSTSRLSTRRVNEENVPKSDLDDNGSQHITCSDSDIHEGIAGI